jgi:tripartite-type tricarboxylate transporter receptor subunit TctC
VLVKRRGALRCGKIREDDVRLFRRLGWLAALVLIVGAARAEDFPSRPIRWIVAFPAGGPTDFVARIVADKVNALTGQTIIIENKPGANAAIGASFVAKSEPDGYTQFFSTSSAFTINPNLRADMPYDAVRDFAPVTLVINSSEILVANPALPVRTVSDLIGLAKSKPIAMASTGVGGLPHLSLELLQSAGGVKILHVPYRGAAPAITDILGGQVQAMFADLPVVLPHIRSGQLRAIATASRRRVEVLPDVPTLDEQGITGVYADTWYALFVPARTPAPVIARMNAVMREALADPEVRRRLLDSGAVPSAGTPEALAEMVKTESASWRKLVTDKGIKLTE